MEEDMQHFWCIMLYYFKKGRKATETHTHTKICTVYREGAVTDRMCQEWFVEFLGTIDILNKNSLLWGCLTH